MKRTVFIYLLAALSLLACQKEIPVSPEDSLPLPSWVVEDKDLEVKPGDSFFDYCNGTWLKNTPIPDEGAVGGVYEANTAMQERIEELKRTNPHIGRFFALMDALHTQPEESQAYLDAQKARYPKPTSREEAFRMMGQLVLDGATRGITFTASWQDGKWIGYIAPPLRLPDVGGESAEPLPSKELIISGMGLDPAQVTSPSFVDKYWAELDVLPLEGLCQLIDAAWDDYKVYVNPEEMEKARMDESGVLHEARLSLNYTISYHLAQKYLPQGFREKYLGITREIQASLRRRIQKVTWMSETTRGNALEKLDNCGLSVACPEKWYPDCVLPLADCQTLVEAVHMNNRGKNQLFAQMIGDTDYFTKMLLGDTYSSDGNYIPTDLTLANAMYDPLTNRVFIYPAHLLPPLLPQNVSEAYEYALFAIIGHEFTHGFDSQGSLYDKDGNNREWWTIADRMEFEKRCENLIQCYNHMELDPSRRGAYGDGERTLSENIADLGGFLVALDAYKAHLEAEGYFGKPYKDQLRKFYESYASLWCVQYSSDKFWSLYEEDVHSHARLRVNGVVMNTDLWYELYEVDRENYLYLPEEARTYIW